MPKRCAKIGAVLTLQCFEGLVSILVSDVSSDLRQCLIEQSRHRRVRHEIPRSPPKRINVLENLSPT